MMNNRISQAHRLMMKHCAAKSDVMMNNRAAQSDVMMKFLAFGTKE
jgi:hypothetical protein